MGIHTAVKNSLQHNISMWNMWKKLIAFYNFDEAHEKYGSCKEFKLITPVAVSFCIAALWIAIVHCIEVKLSALCTECKFCCCAVKCPPVQCCWCSALQKGENSVLDLTTRHCAPSLLPLKISILYQCLVAKLTFYLFTLEGFYI